MAKSTALRKTTNLKLPTPNIPIGIPKLPHNGQIVTDEVLTFSFTSFDREHQLFNLGSGNKREPVKSSWFLDLLDCLKIVSSYTIPQFRCSKYQLHPVDWNNTNAKPPINQEQHEYWQFRINKSKGRVIGIILSGIFYIVWLDPHHNLTDSEGYGKAVYYPRPKSEYELLQEKYYDKEREVTVLQEILEIKTKPNCPD